MDWFSRCQGLQVRASDARIASKPDEIILVNLFTINRKILIDNTLQHIRLDSSRFGTPLAKDGFNARDGSVMRVAGGERPAI